MTAVLLAKLLLIGCASAYLHSPDGSGPVPAATPTAAPTPSADSVSRPVSEPYAGTLDIFEEPDRDKKLQIDRVMNLLGIAEGKNVADIGAGSGWFTVRAARRVGAKGKVFAVEINQQYIDHINERAKKENLPNVETVLGKTDDPMLPEASADAVLMLKTYHEIAEPIKLATRLRRTLRKGGLVGIIDRNGEGDDHGIARETVVEEMGRAGYRLKEEFDFVKDDGMDYFLVFVAK